MEHQLLLQLQLELSENVNLSQTFAATALSLITNPFTSRNTLSSLLDALVPQSQKPDAHRQLIYSLLSALSLHHPELWERISAVAHSLVLLPPTPTSCLPQALSLLDSSRVEPFADESLFLSLCFWQCVKTRRWALNNLNKFCVRPSVFLMVLLGFTKDPYPYVRKGALDGLVLFLRNGVVVEDRSLTEGCYFRAVELLFDADNTVRCSAVLAVSELGQQLIALNHTESRHDWSDALFLQLCSVARDMDLAVRIAAFTALGKIQTVSKDILLQTLSKKTLTSLKEKFYPGQYTATLHRIPASAATFTFVHGMEDEFYEVRKSAAHALQMLTVISDEFAGEAVSRLIDLLIDDSVVVRLQALESLCSMAVQNHFKVEESHLHMFFGALNDSNALVRSAARKALKLIKLQKLTMLRLCIDALIKNLEVYPQDEPDLFSVLFRIGRTHGKYMVKIMREVSQELEPSFEGKLDFNKARTAALFVLAISAPVSLERQICSIPPQIFSYAVTMLGRISLGLVDILDKDALLSYLCHCSRFTFVSASEFAKGEELNLHTRYSDVQLCKKADGTFDASFPELMDLKRAAHPHHDSLLDSHVKLRSCIQIILKNVVQLWPLIQLGCLNEVLQMLSFFGLRCRNPANLRDLLRAVISLISSVESLILSYLLHQNYAAGSFRGWKEELKYFTRDSVQPTGTLIFALKYLHVIKLLGRAWVRCFSPKNLQHYGMGVPEVLLGKLESRLKEMLQRFKGLTREEELHVLELILVTCALTLSYRNTTCFGICMKNIYFVLSRIKYLHEEGSVELSPFVAELQNLSREINCSEDKLIHMLDLLQKSLNLFSLTYCLSLQELKYLDAAMHVSGSDFENPLPFVSGLPVGIPCEVTLYNISTDTRLWIIITLTEKSTQFVFLDLNEFGGSDGIRKFTFVAPFYWTPRAKFFCVRVSIAMEYSPEFQDFKHCNQPKHELVRLCEELDIHFSVAAKYGENVA